MNVKWGGVALALMLGAALPASAGTNLVTNGDFADGSFTGWSSTDLGVFPAQNGFDGFTFPGADAGMAALGSVDLMGTVSQTIAGLTPSEKLDLSIDFGSDGATPNAFEVLWDGKVVDSITNSPATDFTALSFTVTAAGGGDTLTFKGGDGPGFNVFSDVSLSAAAVPEPATWAVMLVGFAGVGLAVRRRKGAGVLA